MPWQIPAQTSAEFAAAFLQGAITLALALVCLRLYHVYRKRYFLVWALAWGLYSLRLGAIISFLLTESRIWLFWHQVVTGWTALALLYGALVFSQGTAWRTVYVAFIAFPVAWSWIAIYRLDNFLLAAGPAVLFLSGATVLTAWAFDRHRRHVGSAAAALLAVTFLLWGLHHLDYPFLRARGIWTPWGYYLDTLFVLGVGLGTLLLVQEDLGRGLRALASLSAVLQPGRRGEDVVAELLERVLALPAVTGSALVLHDGSPRVVRGVEACSSWVGKPLDPVATEAVARAVTTRRPAISRSTADAIHRGHPHIAALPVVDRDRVVGAIVTVGRARDPFAALDEPFLVALGQQIGAALANAELTRRLEARTQELERLAGRMVRQHEDERRRLSRELHDETAQVLAAVSMQLGVARETAAAAAGPPLDRALGLVRDGIRGIRRVTERLRPSLLDDLGLGPALRGLVDDFGETQHIQTTFDAPESLPALSDAAELALFRALQEALANIGLHSGATAAHVEIAADNGQIRLRVRDNGRGMSDERIEDAAASGRTGLVGMRERIQTLGGDVTVHADIGAGVEILVSVPLTSGNGL